jgi:pimeloyl-ACP methyl ester carboxylesterase
MTAPLLVLHDPEDREAAFAEGQELARRWPGAELRVAQGCGHLRILRDGGWVAEAVSFLGRKAAA